MFRSAGSRFLIVGLLAALMAIPMFFVSGVVEERRFYSEESIREIGQQWGGPQTLMGPALILPVEGAASVATAARQLPPRAAGAAEEAAERAAAQPAAPKIVIVEKPPLRVLPATLDIRLDSGTETRARGIFETIVYSAKGEIAFSFDKLDALEKTLGEGERILWERATVVLGLGDNRGLRGETVLRAGDRRIELEPRNGGAGVMARIGDPRELGGMRLSLDLNGAEKLFVAPAGRDSAITLSGDWPHPAFEGAFLPDAREVTESGFTARWRIPNLARAVAQVSRGEHFQDLSNGAMGVRFLRPNDFYQKAYRAAHYAVLFIALTFLTVLILDRKDKPAHPVQYLLIGLAQAIWVLLMVAYAEQVGFGLAYLGASAATVGLITLFAWTGLKMGRRGFVVGVALIALYAVLYMILRSADYALLAGATLAFVALAATMIMTRNENWYEGMTPPAQKKVVANPWSAPPAQGEPPKAS